MASRSRSGGLQGATEPSAGRLDRLLAVIPRILASKAHVALLVGLGAYLIVLPLAGVHVGSGAELIGGNYTNVTSDIGACIAAGGTLHLVREHRSLRERFRQLEERLQHRSEE